MKKTILLSLIFALFAIAGAFANGSSEVEAIADTWDTVTVTGTVTFKDWPHPEISSRGTTYELLVPRFSIDELEIESGDEITIEGVAVDGQEGDEVYLKVIRAVIDGEEYYVPYGGGMAGPGSYRGPHEGYGRGASPERGRFPGQRGGGRF